MPGVDVVRAAARTAARHILRSFEERGSRPPAYAGIRVEANHAQAQVHLLLTAEDNGGTQHHFAGTMQDRAYEYTRLVQLREVHDVVQDVWRQEREEHIVNHHPDILRVRNEINEAQRNFYDPARAAQLQDEHIRIERRVRDEINGVNDWARATAYYGARIAQNTGIVRMTHGGEADMGVHGMDFARRPEYAEINRMREMYRRQYDYDAYASRQRIDYAKAEAKGLALLKRHLTSQQKADYEKHGYFHVKGGDTGKTYRLRHGTHMNIYEVQAVPKVQSTAPKRGWHPFKWDISGPAFEQAVTEYDWKETVGYCFVPAGGLCAGDVLLIQKVSLETDEKAALKVANKFGVQHVGDAPMMVPRDW